MHAGHVVVAVAQPPHGIHRRYGGGSGGLRTCGLSTGRGRKQLLLVLTVAVMACGLPRVSHAWWSQNWACSGGCDYNGNCKSSSSSRFSGTSSCPSGYTDGSSNWYWSGTCSYTGCYYICSDECECDRATCVPCVDEGRACKAPPPGARGCGRKQGTEPPSIPQNHLALGIASLACSAMLHCTAQMKRVFRLGRGGFAKGRPRARRSSICGRPGEPIYQPLRNSNVYIAGPS